MSSHRTFNKKRSWLLRVARVALLRQWVPNHRNLEIRFVRRFVLRYLLEDTAKQNTARFPPFVVVLKFYGFP